MAHLYILFPQSLDKYYISHTEHTPEKSLKDYLSNHPGFTSKAKDWQIVFSQSFETEVEAYAAERKVKSWQAKKVILKVIPSGD